MDRDQRSRQQKSRGGSFTRPAQKRSLSSRMGLQKQRPQTTASRRPAPNPNPQPQRRQAPPAQQYRHATQQLNPQKAGYTPGAPRRQRRVTQAELLRRRNRRRALGVLGVLAVLALGAIVSINLLFKVTSFRVETFDRTTPADTGIYTEDEIIAALGIETNTSLFGFSTTEKNCATSNTVPVSGQCGG